MADGKIITGGSGGGYATIENNGSSLPQEVVLNFVGANVTIADNPGNSSTDVTISTGASTPYTAVTSNTALVADNGYFANSASNLTFTLPATAAVGALFNVMGINTGEFIIAQRASQYIIFGNQITTTGTGGSITSQGKGDGVTIICCATNNGFIVRDSVGGQFTVT